MKKLINLLFAGKTINTSEGELAFDDKGICVLEDEVADAFKNVKGFVVENDGENNEDGEVEEDSVEEENSSENNDNTPEDGENEDAPEDIEEDSDEEPIDLKSLTVPALKKYAKDNGINIAGLEKKDQIIEAIAKNQD